MTEETGRGTGSRKGRGTTSGGRGGGAAGRASTGAKGSAAGTGHAAGKGPARGREAAGGPRDRTGGRPASDAAATAASAPDATLLDRLAPRRGLRRLAGGVVLAEGAVLLVGAAFLVVELFRSTPTETGGAIAQAVVVLLIGLGLLQLGRVTLRADERARVPVLVWQVLQVSVGGPALSSRWYVAALAIGTALVAGVGVLAPGVLRPDVRGLARD